MTVVIEVKSTFGVNCVNLDGVHVVPDPDSLTADLDRVMEALLELEDTDCGIFDSGVAADLAAGEVEISVMAEAATYEKAEEIASSCVRSAIHKAGGATPGWTGLFEVQNKQSELVTS